MDRNQTETDSQLSHSEQGWNFKDLNELQETAYNILYYIGSCIIREYRRVTKRVSNIAKKYYWFAKRTVVCYADSVVKKKRSAINCTWVYPLRHFKVSWKECQNRLKIAKANKNTEYLKKDALLDVLHTWKPVGKVALHAMNYVGPVLGAAALFFTFQHYDNMTYALGIEYNGENVGYVHSEYEFLEAEKKVQERIVSDDYEFPDDYIPRYSLQVVDEEKISTVDDLTNRIIEVSGNEIQEASGLYVDGEFIGATTDGDGLVLELKGILDETREEAGEDAKVSFVQNVKVDRALYPVSSIVELSNISEELTKEVAAARTYIIQSGDTPYDIAMEYEIPLDTLIRNNEEVVKRFLPGDSLLIESAVPLLEKKVVKTVTEDKKINFKTEQIQNNNYGKGFTKVKQNGEPGIERIVSEVTFIDGFEVERAVIERSVVKEPVDAILEVGTLMPQQYLNNISGGNVGGFIWPPDGGYISCPIWGYGGHTGTDIAGKAGTPIRASADGTVVYSGFRRAYGNVVIIDHGNNIRTLYAHNSALHVAAGQYVQQGQLIASMGRTGNASGNHCHFEIIINGQYKDARQYIGYSYPGR